MISSSKLYFLLYFLIAFLLLVGQLVWFQIADRYNIIDKPNERSSHNSVTIRGGGIIFPIAILCWFLFFNMPYPWFTGGLLLIAMVSLLDDIRPLLNSVRITFQFVGVAMMIYSIGLFEIPWYWLCLAFILVIGTINAFNFMDGINGITAFYALSCLTAFYYLNQQFFFTDSHLILVTALALVVFSFFNARRQAKTFAGDVGSVSIAFVLCFLMLQLIIETTNPAYILLFAVYGVDSVLTIVHRLMKKENIFIAHRSHLYQYLANEKGVPHVLVSIIYGSFQLILSFAVIFLISFDIVGPWLLMILVLVLLSLIYLTTKAYIIKRLNTR